jgi:alpha-L-fucosidase
MKHFRKSYLVSLALLLLCGLGCTGPGTGDAAADIEVMTEKDKRMAWWREARFGMFIHWGLYAIPAGEWEGGTDHAEWIRTTAQIPIEVYDRFVDQFNPVKFDADEWVRIAKDAGMKYIVITSKHHDGFCLFDSAHTDYDVMSTPFKRDIMQELADACRRAGLRICWYHSIMDWHHPDYLPRRNWEDRSEEGADMDRYVAHMKKQLRELVKNYGDIGVLWFDGEWEGTWTHEYGRDLYDYVRSLDQDIIINNRVDKGREGMEGMMKSDEYRGDFGTPEQQIPATGFPGVDWETCMTMNRHWGWNKHDNDWKSTEDLLRKLADIASKGGNFLLNVGPTAEGLIPQPSVERLAAMGKWMRKNGEAIYGTSASPFEKLPWGRCTQKALDDGGTRLYLHVFDWPEDGRLFVPGLDNAVREARLLTDADAGELEITRRGTDVFIYLPLDAPDPINSVVVLDIEGAPCVIEAPRIEAASTRFVDSLKVSLSTTIPETEIRYTLNGGRPTMSSSLYSKPFTIRETATVKAGLFRDGRLLTRPSEMSFEQVSPRASETIRNPRNGLEYAYYEGQWKMLPDFEALDWIFMGYTQDIDIGLRQREEYYGFRLTGFINVPEEGLYRFFTDSDDGSQLFIGDTLVVDNDGLHSLAEASGEIALSAGYHPLTITFFECTGSEALKVSVSGPGIEKQRIDGFCYYQGN